MTERTIRDAIFEVMQGLTAISKSQVNQHQKFKFRGIDDVYNHVFPQAKKVGLFSTSTILWKELSEVTTRSGTARHALIGVEYHWHAKGCTDYISTSVIGEAIDSGDKAFGKALVYAHKYALLQLFMIPTDDLDPDKESPEIVKTKKTPPSPEVSGEIYQELPTQKKQFAQVLKNNELAMTREEMVRLSEACKGTLMRDLEAKIKKLVK